MEWYEVIVSICAGLATTIPLVIKLIEYVKKSMKEKNWNKMLDLVTKLMIEAEEKFDNGDDRKDWVMMAIKASADTIDYDINMDDVSKLIDSLCYMSKKVNSPAVEEEVSE